MIGFYHPMYHAMWDDCNQPGRFLASLYFPFQAVREPKVDEIQKRSLGRCPGDACWTQTHRKLYLSKIETVGRVTSDTGTGRVITGAAHYNIYGAYIQWRMYFMAVI